MPGSCHDDAVLSGATESVSDSLRPTCSYSLDRLTLRLRFPARTSKFAPAPYAASCNPDCGGAGFASLCPWNRIAPSCAVEGVGSEALICGGAKASVPGPGE